MKRSAAERSEPVPLAAKVGESVRPLRLAGAWDQATLAETMTRLGVPTKVATINRIESGRQAVTLEQLVVLGVVLTPDGAAGLLDPGTGGWHAGRWRSRTRRSDAGSHRSVGRPGRQAESTGRQPLPTGRAGVARGLRRTAKPHARGSARGVDRGVAAAAKRRFKRTSQDEVRVRFGERLDEAQDDRPGPESAAWRAYMGHAVRSVQADLATELGGHS